jgi:hypothetical protein
MPCPSHAFPLDSVPVALNLCYWISSATVDTDEGQADVGKFVLLGESERSVADVLRPEVKQQRLGQRSWEVLEVAREADEPVGPGDIAANVEGMAADDAGKYLRRSAEANLLIKLARGRYTYRRV